MFFYHFDRSGSFENANFISLINNYHEIDNLQHIDLEYLCKYYSEGLSQHGLRYIGTYSVSQHNTATLLDCSCTLANLTQLSIESIFELVRIAHFAELPSRLSCLFCTKTFEDIYQWENFTDDTTKYYKIDVDLDEFHEFDASWLRSAFVYFTTTDKTVLGYSHLTAYDFAMKYWSKQISDTPQMEVLIPLPIKINHKESIQI